KTFCNMFATASAISIRQNGNFRPAVGLVLVTRARNTVCATVYQPGFSIPFGHHPIPCDAPAYEVIDCRLRTSLRQGLVVRMGTPTIGMARQFNFKCWVITHGSHQLVQY